MTLIDVFESELCPGMHRNRRDDLKSRSEFESNFKFISKIVEFDQKFVDYDQKSNFFNQIRPFFIKFDYFQYKLDYFRLNNGHWIDLNQLKDIIYIKNNRL